ncbi:class I SAM-dependent methyltransferase [Actinomadura algeriensis]|uniref:SAM-dependent methyltransferase n=1 Tax=Actinomadura algeriensis TaxID=1679523 RepID=A0ABR9JJL0_9ACTN|nr:class I SAM-dependent methyltransferase [Actinomadura algeriensis]MBE1530732.1 SAM-dependent methyltransferase [Actinomadura algeriensis]
MPTLPLDPHQARQMAESFGADTERYDRTRPRYPDAMVRAIVDASPGPDVLDVGCGTGIEARQFAASGCRILGVEPDARMAAFARAHGFDVEVATFEDWDPAGRTFDAVIAGTAWHWVDPRAGAAKAARVLRPGGRFAAFWNVFEPPPAVAEATADACRRVMPDSPIDFRAVAKGGLAGYRPMLDKAADDVRAADGLGDVEQWVFDWERPYTRAEWLDQIPTQGAFTRLPPDDLAQILDATGAAIDTLGGTFTMRYATVVLTAPHTP